MDDFSPADALEARIESWRHHLRRDRPDPVLDLARVETQLRAECAALTRLGLAPDEAFLVAAKRTRTLAAAAEIPADIRHRGGKASPAIVPDSSGEYARRRREAIVAFACAGLAAASTKVPALFGVSTGPDADGGFYARNASFFVLPWLTAYFVWKRALAPRIVAGLGLLFLAAAVFANLPGFGNSAAFGQLTALHVPIALLPVVGIAYAGGRWGQISGRMDFIRFAGELVIHFVLIALGGGVFTGLMALMFSSIGVDLGRFFESWLLPCGATGAVLVAAWLVEARQRFVEALAPMLTRLFTPLFAAMLVTFLVAMFWSGRGLTFERDLLIGFDLLLVVVLGLLLYALSARDPRAGPGAFDAVQIVLVVAALLTDFVALWVIGGRIGEFGFTPNRVAALGENLILLVNLAGAAVLHLRFVTGRGTLLSLERWHTAYLPVYAIWAAVVVIVFPLLLS